MSATVEMRYWRVGAGRPARQVTADPGCILDVDALGDLVGIEILNGRELIEVLAAVWRAARSDGLGARARAFAAGDTGTAALDAKAGPV